MRLVRICVALGLALTVLPLAMHLLVRVAQRYRTWPEDPLAVAAGALVGAGLIAWRQPSRFLHTFVHESCHALACFALRVKLRSFRASEGRGGEVEHDACGPLRSTLILIAPYTLPVLLLPTLLLQECFSPGFVRECASVLVGLAIPHHLAGLWLNLRQNSSGSDSDLAKTGLLLGIVLVLIAFLITAAFTVAVLCGSPLRDLVYGFGRGFRVT